MNSLPDPALFTEINSHSDKFPFYKDLGKPYVNKQGKILICKVCKYVIDLDGNKTHNTDQCKLIAEMKNISPPTYHTVPDKNVKFVHPRIWENWVLPGLAELDLYYEFEKIKAEKVDVTVSFYPDMDKLDVSIKNDAQNVGAIVILYLMFHLFYG